MGRFYWINLLRNLLRYYMLEFILTTCTNRLASDKMSNRLLSMEIIQKSISEANYIAFWVVIHFIENQIGLTNHIIRVRSKTFCQFLSHSFIVNECNHRWHHCVSSINRCDVLLQRSQEWKVRKYRVWGLVWLQETRRKDNLLIILQVKLFIKLIWDASKSRLCRDAIEFHFVYNW